MTVLSVAIRGSLWTLVSLRSSGGNEKLVTKTSGNYPKVTVRATDSLLMKQTEQCNSIAMKAIIDIKSIPTSARNQGEGNVPPNEFRATVARDGRACSHGLIFVTPDGVTFAHPSYRVMNGSRETSAVCRLLSGEKKIAIIIPASDRWSLPETLMADIIHPSEMEKYYEE